MNPEVQQENKPNKIAKAYKAVHQFVADKSNIISPLADTIPNPKTTENETQQTSQQLYGVGSKLLLSNPTTALIGLSMLGSQKADLNTIATDFNDDFGNSNNLSFLENAVNFVGSLTPFAKVFGTSINPVDKSRLQGSFMYNWHNDLDKYNNGNKPFSVLSGGNKLNDESSKYQLQVDTASNIKDEGARAMKFDPYRVAKQTDNELRHAFDARYNLSPTGKSGMKIQFAKRSISKHKIKKQQSGGQIEKEIDPNTYFTTQSDRDKYINRRKIYESGEYLKKYWDPDTQPFSDFIDSMTSNIRRDEYDVPLDEDIMNNPYWGLSEFDVGKASSFDVQSAIEEAMQEYDPENSYSYQDAAALLDKFNSAPKEDRISITKNAILKHFTRHPEQYSFYKLGGKINKYQIGGTLPKWLMYDEDRNEYVSDFYESSPKEDIQELKNYVKQNLKGWKVWQSPLAKKRYFVLPEQEANNRDLQILKQIDKNYMSGSSGSKVAPPIGDSIGIDGKELTYVGDQVNDFGPYNFEDENGTTYYFPEYKKEGGKVNVIPSGALHAHKHNLTKEAENGEKFEDVTTKGIPVVVEDEKGNLIQQAEVEREEIIFRLEVTKKLEELSKKHTDEAAIEAGKLLVYEILENTDDKTNNML